MGARFRVGVSRRVLYIGFKPLFGLLIIIKKILDFKLNETEQAAFNKSADAVRSMNDVLKTL